MFTGARSNNIYFHTGIGRHWNRKILQLFLRIFGPPPRGGYCNNYVSKNLCSPRVLQLLLYLLDFRKKKHFAFVLNRLCIVIGYSYGLFFSFSCLMTFQNVTNRRKTLPANPADSHLIHRTMVWKIFTQTL